MISKYNYTTIFEAFEALKGVDRGHLEYLDEAISLLATESPKLAAYKGSLSGRKLILQTAKGRTSYDLSNEEIELVFSEYEKADTVLNNINEVVMLVKMKMKILNDNFVH